MSDMSKRQDALVPTHHRHEGDAFSVVPGPPHTCIAPVRCEGVVVLTPAEVAQMRREWQAEAWDEGLAKGATTSWYRQGNHIQSMPYVAGDPAAPTNPYRAEASGAGGHETD